MKRAIVISAVVVAALITGAVVFADDPKSRDLLDCERNEKGEAFVKSSVHHPEPLLRADTPEGAIQKFVGEDASDFKVVDRTSDGTIERARVEYIVDGKKLGFFYALKRLDGWYIDKHFICAEVYRRLSAS